MKPSNFPALHRCRNRSIAAAGALMALSPLVSGAAELLFDFNSDKPLPDAMKVTPQSNYDAQRGWGFTGNASAVSGSPQAFAIDLEEGNYNVAMRFGNPSKATSTTIKAEARRLMLLDVKTEPGEWVTRTFTVNIRQPEYAKDEKVALKSREYGPPMSPSWDGQLGLEFNGKQPGVVAMKITPAPDATTVFLAGDSTVTDQTNEPWAGWGQMLPSFFEPGLAVSNHAESGLALFSFSGQRRLKKIQNMAKPGDFLLIQFGHNDQKDRREGAGPFTTYKAELKSYIDAFRERNGIPVLVTPMERRRWSEGKPQTTLDDYADAVRQVGKEMDVPVIDLHAMSLEFYEALGEKDSTMAFVFYPPNTFPYQKDALKDNTHHNAYGGYELARCVIKGIKSQVPDLAKYLRSEPGHFDPSKPDAPDQLAIPSSPIEGENETPDGN